MSKPWPRCTSCGEPSPHCLCFYCARAVAVTALITTFATSCAGVVVQWLLCKFKEN